MLENCLSEFVYIKNILDNETDPRFFDKEFSFFIDEPVLFYLAGSDRIIYINHSFTRQLDYTADDLNTGKYAIADLFCNQEEYIKFSASVQQRQESLEGWFCLLSREGIKKSYTLSAKWLYKDCYVISLKETGDPQQKKDEPSRQNKELDEFAYVASHDLQEPLRKITTFIQRLEQKLGDTTDEDVYMYIKRINVSAANMRNLIDSLLEFSRVDRNNEPVGKVDLSVELPEVIAALSPKIEASGVSINLESLPVVEAIPSQMRQLFQNLLDNAIKFSKNDIAPVVNITSREVTDEEKKKYNLSGSKSYCMITVTDNGIGFDPVYAEKIFQLFQRLHGKHEYPGAGMGLGICRKIIMNTGGYIFADGVPGEGSSFYIILPKHPVTDV
jgi:light-regulated signal transduction histidine kinase (bacteriophytochrome)